MAIRRLKCHQLTWAACACVCMHVCVYVCTYEFVHACVCVRVRMCLCEVLACMRDHHMHVIWGGGYMHVIWGGGYMRCLLACVTTRHLKTRGVSYKKKDTHIKRPRHAQKKKEHKKKEHTYKKTTRQGQTVVVSSVCDVWSSFYVCVLFFCAFFFVGQTVVGSAVCDCVYYVTI